MNTSVAQQTGFEPATKRSSSYIRNQTADTSKVTTAAYMVQQTGIEPAANKQGC